MQQVRSITTFIFAFFLLGTLSAYANTGTSGKDKNDGKNKTEVKVDADKKKASPDPQNKNKEDTESASDNTERTVAPEDSTTNSLNKLNFIFYFIYKHKYDSPSEAVARLFD